MGEWSEKARTGILEKLWELAGQFLVIIEPGTKLAFESLKKVREALLLKGAHLIAPCPHSQNCPLKEKDWCHFSARIERSSLHRKAKGAALNYEDEKFSYLIFSKDKIEPCHGRVLRHPFKGKGFVKLQLCSRGGTEEKIVTQKNKSHYSYAKKVEWGDEFLSYTECDSKVGISAAPKPRG
jgi:ribosomal protein RSM22 (predicted rRNA methylase)